MNLPVKYRPKTFDDVVGQLHVTTTLKNALRSKRISSAYLFTGQKGVGKTTVARIFAKGLNCEKGITPQPCGVCPICREIESGKSMDVLEIDGASNRGIDQIRELRENVRFVPVKARYKVIIIDEVHMLTHEAFNALLKTLEEPPPNVVFIFATTEVRKIPDTVLSRTQKFDFKPLLKDEIIKRLQYICEQEQIDYEKGSLELMYKASGGSMRDAITLLEQAYIYSNGIIKLHSLREILGILRDEIFVNIFTYARDGKNKEAIALLDDIIMQGYSLHEFYNGLVEHIHLLLRAKLKEEPNIMHEFADTFSVYEIMYFLKIAEDMEYILKNSRHPRVFFDYNLLRFVNVPKIVLSSLSAPITHEEQAIKGVKYEDKIKKLIDEFGLKEVDDGHI